MTSFAQSPKIFKKYTVFYEDDVICGGFQSPCDAFIAFFRAFSPLLDAAFTGDKGDSWDWIDEVVIAEINDDDTYGASYGVDCTNCFVCRECQSNHYITCSVHPINLRLEKGEVEKGEVNQ